MDVAPYEAALGKAGLAVTYQASLDGVSGLLLMGGPDINPDLYGEERAPQTDEPDNDRDAVELWLLADAISRNMPILAIDRGMQLMNVFHGGSLVQHVPPTGGHGVRVTPGSQLCRIFGMRLMVNSKHHQAVKRPGGALLIAARADDGILEGIERPDLNFCVGVQWHPEEQPDHGGLFQAFGAAVRSWGSSNGMTSTATSTVCSAPPSRTP